MGTVGRGRVLELWLLGPDVVVEPGEKLADTRAARKREKGKVMSTVGTRVGTDEWLTEKECDGSYTCSSRGC